MIDLHTHTILSDGVLLPAELACDFLPSVCMKVPSHSAWIPLQIDVAAYVDSSGSLSMLDLKQALIECVDAGDKQHDQTVWSEPLIEYDSWLNRRLAIVLRGWGDIVEKRGADPSSLQTLREMEALAEWACKTLHERSRQLAGDDNWCPALDEARALVMQKKHTRDWGRRWKKALQEVAIRHRNLTTISPWDVFPQQKEADLRYADLLPLMRFADSLSFQRNVSLDHWNVNDFKGFGGRVAAIVRCNAGADLVAKQV